MSGQVPGFLWSAPHYKPESPDLVCELWAMTLLRKSESWRVRVASPPAWGVRESRCHGIAWELDSWGCSLPSGPSPGEQVGGGPGGGDPGPRSACTWPLAEKGPSPSPHQLPGINCPQQHPPYPGL